jgi:hypothetical protein
MKSIYVLGISTVLAANIYFKIINLKLFLSIALVISFLYLILKLRYEFSLLPLLLITKIQRRNFKILNNMSEIKKVLKLSDKGHVIEELFATPAWHPILSVESTNGNTWETLRKNLLAFIEHIPSKEKLGSIAQEEATNLIKKGVIIDSKQISKSTLKIFLKWLFSKNEKTNKNMTEEISSTDTCQNSNQLNKDLNPADEYDFINRFLTDEFLDKMYHSSLEYRKEIAIKGKGCVEKKQYAVDSIVNILKQSKFSHLYDWEKPECYSFIMQPFIISPMINISDIAVSLQNFYSKYNKNEFKNFNTYLDFCLFTEHPFPILERYEAETNTQYFIDLKSLKDHVSLNDGSVLNFGMGIRGCLGRVYAREFINSFFENLLEEEKLFFPKLGHLYSGRDNDNGSLSESVYQIKVLFNVLKDEIRRNISSYK